MTALHEKFRKKGVLVVGVSDETHELIDEYVKKHAITFPIARIDEKAGFEEAIGVQGFPTAALIGPDGKLIWTGHPAEADSYVEKAAKSSKMTPLLPAACAAAEKLLNEGKSGLAWVELEKLAAGGTLQGDDAKAVTDLIAYFERDAGGLWKSAEAALAAKDYLKAAAACERLVAYAGKEPGDNGKAKLAELRADPALVKEIDGGKQNAAAAELEKELEFKEAMKLYKQVVAKYAGSEAAKAAQKRLDVIKDDDLLKMDKNCELCRAGNRPCSRHAK
ncbi:MAG: redoxin family protein [Planctomycetes bacterium]|nr:redoxin family protein [Planctomycetota bacterium]